MLLRLVAKEGSKTYTIALEKTEDVFIESILLYVCKDINAPHVKESRIEYTSHQLKELSHMRSLHGLHAYFFCL